jgi:hypothetical protein
MTWRSAWPPLSVLAFLVAAAAADLVLPVPGNLTQARATALGILLTAALGVIAFLLQAWQARRSQKLATLRGAFRSMIGATQLMLDQRGELASFPFGHPYPGIVSNVNMPDDYFRHDPFEPAKALEAEWRRLYIEGERELLLETDRDDDVLVAWRNTRKSFWAWVDRLRAIAREAEAGQAEAVSLEDDNELARLDRELRQNIDAFATICRARIRALS